MKLNQIFHHISISKSIPYFQPYWVNRSGLFCQPFFRCLNQWLNWISLILLPTKASTFILSAGLSIWLLIETLLPTNSLNPENKVENWNLEYITFKGIGTQKLQNKQALKTIRLKFENYFQPNCDKLIK